MAATVDKPTVSTELGTSNLITITLTSEGGFAGPVDIAASLVDASQAPLSDWLVAVNPASVTLAAGGTATAVATVAIPSDATSLMGDLKLDLTSDAGSTSVTSNITSLQQLTFDINIVNGQCVYPVDTNTTVTVRVGTVVRFRNTSTADNLVVHAQGMAAAGIPHQGSGTNESPDDPVTEPNTAYTRTTVATENGGGWYCHSPANGSPVHPLNIIN